jgi:hypothetical protein
MRANLVEPGSNLFDKLVNGAPPMAPLLFPNLRLLDWRSSDCMGCKRMRLIPRYSMMGLEVAPQNEGNLCFFNR